MTMSFVRCLLTDGPHNILHHRCKNLCFLLLMTGMGA